METTIPNINANATPAASIYSSIDQYAQRREQNRLAQRRYRERKRRQLEVDNLSQSIENNYTSHLVSSRNQSSQGPTGPISLRKQHNTNFDSFQNAADVTFEQDAVLFRKSNDTINTISDSYQTFPDEHCIFMHTYHIKRAFFYISRSITDVVFSYKFDPRDERLTSPINSAALSKMAANNRLPIIDTLPESSPSSYSDSSASSRTLRWNEALKMLPENLRPTQLQLSVTHHPRIDVFPWPGFRDRLMLMGQHLHKKHSCQELLDGLRVWGNRPELEDSWEISPRFAQMAWFLLDSNIIKRTNWWRSQRNLPPIDIEAISKAQTSLRK